MSSVTLHPSIETSPFYFTAIQLTVLWFYEFFPTSAPIGGHLSCFKSFAFPISALRNALFHIFVSFFFFFFTCRAGQEKCNIMVHTLTV